MTATLTLINNPKRSLAYERTHAFRLRADTFRNRLRTVPQTGKQQPLLLAKEILCCQMATD